jgi:predicted amidohydrolase
MLRIGFVQTSPIFGDLDGNRERLIEQAGRLDADLVVLPELCQSGYVFTSRAEAVDLAESIPAGPTSQALAELARARDMTLVAGIGERAGERLYNSAAVFTPAGHLLTYRKIHLFGDEKRWFEPGDTAFPVFEVRGARIGLIVCYDWRFPEATRVLALAGADVVAHPANLVLPFCQQVMRARCIENRVFAVTANRVGTDDRPGGRRATFTGRSQVVDPDGQLLLQASTDGVEDGVVTIDPRQARDKTFNDGMNHVLTDRRPEYYRALVEPPAPAGDGV